MCEVARVGAARERGRSAVCRVRESIDAHSGGALAAGTEVLADRRTSTRVMRIALRVTVLDFTGMRRSRTGCALARVDDASGDGSYAIRIAHVSVRSLV
jgi:hypothetical protein